MIIGAWRANLHGHVLFLSCISSHPSQAHLVPAAIMGLGVLDTKTEQVPGELTTVGISIEG